MSSVMMLLFSPNGARVWIILLKFRIELIELKSKNWNFQDTYSEDQLEVYINRSLRILWKENDVKVKEIWGDYVKQW